MFILEVTVAESKVTQSRSKLFKLRKVLDYSGQRLISFQLVRIKDFKTESENEIRISSLKTFIYRTKHMKLIFNTLTRTGKMTYNMPKVCEQTHMF